MSIFILFIITISIISFNKSICHIIIFYLQHIYTRSSEMHKRSFKRSYKVITQLNNKKNLDHLCLDMYGFSYAI